MTGKNTDGPAARSPSQPQNAATPSKEDVLRDTLIARDAIAHITAHDLRTPLNTLHGLIHLLGLRVGAEESAPSEKAQEYIDYMNKAVHQMGTIIDTFQDQSRAAALPITCEALDVRACIDRALEAVRAPDCGAQIEVLGPAWTVSGDPDLMHLLLFHVLRNALQHPHPDRPLGVRIDMSAPGQLAISDTGTGFDPTTAHGIFLPVAGDGDTPDRFGLSVCKEICHRHDWQISAQSDGQSGAAVDIRFE